jgi:endonuclease-3
MVRRSENKPQLTLKTTDWNKAVGPLLKKYKGRRHPLEYGTIYQLVVMVILSAGDSDIHINHIAPRLFAAFPDMTDLSKTTPDKLYKIMGGGWNFAKKAGWLVGMAKKIKKDNDIPLKMDELIPLPGIGRKSANVILREAGKPAEGVMVDLHTIRVATRLGIASGNDPGKIEQQLMKTLTCKNWDAGMSMSFLGREICRPKPNCEICLMKGVCSYYKQVAKKNK